MDRWKDFLPRLGQWISENRATQEGRRILALVILVFLAWGSALFLHFNARETESRIPLQAARFASLAETAQAYRAALPSRKQAESRTNAADPLAAASETIDRLRVKDRLKSLSSSTRGVSLELEGLGPEETVSLLRELKKAHLSVASAEIRALPVSGKRSLSVSLLLGGQP
jgi:hypothetical protein